MHPPFSVLLLCGEHLCAFLGASRLSHQTTDTVSRSQSTCKVKGSACAYLGKSNLGFGLFLLGLLLGSVLYRLFLLGVVLQIKVSSEVVLGHFGLEFSLVIWRGAYMEA